MPQSRWILVMVSLVMLVSLGSMIQPVQPPLYEAAAESRPLLLTHSRDYGVTYMPLRPGESFTYITTEGEKFTLTMGAPFAERWLDDTIRVLSPMKDTRCGCQVLLQTVEDEIRAVGSIRNGKTDQWGEYLLVLPRNPVGVTETITTPAGVFPETLRVSTSLGTVWFAPDVGIVKTELFTLIAIHGPSYWPSV